MDSEAKKIIPTHIRVLPTIVSGRFPKHVLPRSLIAPDNAILPLTPARHANPLCHEPQEPLIALIQGPLDKQVEGNVPRRQRL